MRLVDIGLITAAMAIWGANLAIAKLGFHDVPPLFLVSARFAIAAAVLCPFTRIGRGQVWPVAAASFTFSLYFALSYIGLAGLGAGTAAFLTQLQVPFAGIAAAIAFRERLTVVWLLGVVVALGGTALVAAEAAVHGDAWHVLLFVLSALAWSLAHLQVKRMQGVNALALNAYVSLFAAIPMFGAALALHGWSAVRLTDPLLDGLVIAYQGLFVGVAAYALWYSVVGRYPVHLTAPFTMVIPIFGLVTGAVFLGELLSPTILTGGALTLFGVCLVLIRPKLAAGDALRTAGGAKRVRDRSV
jgi:O-acetylserine/cysteine efflux transporter